MTIISEMQIWYECMIHFNMHTNIQTLKIQSVSLTNTHFWTKYKLCIINYYTILYIITRILATHFCDPYIIKLLQ